MNGVVGAPVLQFFKTFPEVIYNLLVNEFDFTIRRSRHDLAVNAVDHQASPLLTLAQSLFSVFAIIDVRDKRIPVENSSFVVVHGDHSYLKPAIHAIEPTQAILEIK